jgi:hypothetical protein
MSVRWWLAGAVLGLVFAASVLLRSPVDGDLPAAVRAAVAFISGVVVVWLLEAVVSAVRWFVRRRDA